MEGNIHGFVIKFALWLHSFNFSYCIVSWVNIFCNSFELTESLQSLCNVSWKKLTRKMLKVQMKADSLGQIYLNPQERKSPVSASVFLFGNWLLVVWTVINSGLSMFQTFCFGWFSFYCTSNISSDTSWCNGAFVISLLYLITFFKMAVL